MNILNGALERLCDCEDLSADEADGCISAVMEGECSAVQIAALLTGLRVKGESISEIVGAARAMQERATPIATSRTNLLDTCGTGGDQLCTFNISTATALVAAAAGIPVAKHGNRSVSSSSGSAEVLVALGVNIDVDPQTVARCIDEAGIGFCFAPLLHGAMKHAAPVRKELRFRTIFNLLGPLTNPAGAENQLLGANTPETAEKLARALTQLGRQHAVVVCGNGELDEVSLWGTTRAFEVTGEQLQEHAWTADSFGLDECSVTELEVHSPSASAAVIRDVFAGAAGPARDIVLANTAAALFAATGDGDLQAGVCRAAEAIDSGAAQSTLAALVDLTQAGG